MALWHETIEHDKQFNTDIATEMRNTSGDSHSHGYRDHQIQMILHEIGHVHRAWAGGGVLGTAYNEDDMGGGSRLSIDGRNMDRKQVTRITRIIGDALFNTLLDSNPDYVKRLLSHGLGVCMDGELMELELRKQQAMYERVSQSMEVELPTSVASTIRLKNDDYEYWWEFSEFEDIVFVMSDYDGTPETGLYDIEFDPEDEEERASAISHVEDMVKKLCNNELDINTLVDGPPEGSTIGSGSTATEVRMQQKAIYPSDFKFKTNFGTMLKKDADKALISMITTV